MITDETVHIEDLPLNAGVHLLTSNEDGLVALEKPEGAMSHPNRQEDIKRSLLKASYDYDGEFFFWQDGGGHERKVWLINRLDSPTSGVILIGLNEEIASIIKQEFSTHKVTKYYHALVRHQPQRNAGIWGDVISKDLVNNGRKIKKGRKIKAKSGYQLITKPVGGFPISLLKLIPVTGRTHQLRIQCKKHGHPIVGDRSYGSFSFNKEVAMLTGVKRMMLHASELIVHYAYKGKVREFHAKSELPEIFSAVLRYRPGMPKIISPEADKPTEVSKDVLEGRRFKEV